MRIYSWNICYRNPDLDGAFSFISSLKFDVLCLQEVPERFLPNLEKLGYSLAKGLDIERFERGIVVRNYCVILTPHPILETRPFLFPPHKLPPRTRAFMYGMWRLWNIGARGSVYADVEFPKFGRSRVFCVHATLSYPERIMLEFETAMRLLNDSATNIVCADLNVLESPHIALLNWLMGGRLRDIFAWRRTRVAMEKKFTELGFQNPLRGKSTQTISCSQLDHILIPQNMRVARAEVMPGRHGSDHHPVFVECN